LFEEMKHEGIVWGGATKTVTGKRRELPRGPARPAPWGK
jgi:hypothetical protein